MSWRFQATHNLEADIRSEPITVAHYVCHIRRNYRIVSYNMARDSSVSFLHDIDDIAAQSLHLDLTYLLAVGLGDRPCHA